MGRGVPRRDVAEPRAGNAHVMRVHRVTRGEERDPVNVEERALAGVLDLQGRLHEIEEIDRPVVGVPPPFDVPIDRLFADARRRKRVVYRKKKLRGGGGVREARGYGTRTGRIRIAQSGKERGGTPLTFVAHPAHLA